MDNSPSSPASPFNSENRIKILLAEYDAIEKMHAHYDVVNMSMTAIITAGVFTIWGIVIQSAFQSHSPIDYPIFVDSVSILALTLFFVLSVWIRYLTIHRCIVIQKLSRSHEIESILKMKQNLMFQYRAEKLKAPLDSDIAKRRPGGHTLELFLYFSLATMGGLIAMVFQWYIRDNWNTYNFILFSCLLISPIVAILWMSFCKLDVVIQMKGLVEVGLPWNVLFLFIIPINRLFRWILNLSPKQY